MYMIVINMNLIHAFGWLSNMSSDKIKDEFDRACSMCGKPSEHTGHSLNMGI
jgi:hypothetical protein